MAHGQRLHGEPRGRASRSRLRTPASPQIGGGSGNPVVFQVTADLEGDDSGLVNEEQDGGQVLVTITDNTTAASACRVEPGEHLSTLC